MNRRWTPRALTSAVLFALLVTAGCPQPAFADEGTLPPPPDAAIESPPQASDPAAADPAPEPSADPAAAEAPPGEGAEPPAPEPVPEVDPSSIESQPAPTQALPEEVGSAAPEAAVDPLAAVPEGTTIAVVNAAGEAVPLVSGEAEAVLAGGDPIWCPASVKAPTPLLNGCSNAETSMANLITNFLLPSEPAIDGIIWIQAGTQSDVSTITLQGSSLTTMSNFRLTLRGGWDGTSGSKAITPLAYDPDTDTSSGGSRFTVALEILNWNADVTLSDLEFDSASGSSALQITQAGDSPGSITLNRVRSHNNTGGGALLDNSDGSGKITVTSSWFDDNGSVGLSAAAMGLITLADLTASDNGNAGAVVSNAYDGTTAGITLTGPNLFEDNTYAGLQASSRGAITANNLTATGNGVDGGGGDGVDLDNDNGTASASSPGIKLTGTNIFAGNYTSGLSVESDGPIALNSLYAHANRNGSGVWIDNEGAIVSMPVTLTGTSSMKYNDDYGLYLHADGKITVNNLTANGNGIEGALLFNGNAPTSADVLLTGVNAFHDNGSFGLEVTSKGAISAANLAADRNGSLGASINNSYASSAKAVTLTGTSSFHDNTGINLRVVSKGAITLSNVTASGSTTSAGANLDNSGAIAPQKVTLSGTNVFEGNATTGLFVSSLGAITISNLRAIGNGVTSGDGAYLDNSGVGAVGGVTLTGSTITSDNYGSGLWMATMGNIAAANLTASGNQHAWGAYLDNDTGTGSVTLTGTNTFNDNYAAGLSISSAGMVKVSNLTASRTVHGAGAGINNLSAGPDTPKDVLLSGTHLFEENYDVGLQIRSYGAITLSSASAFRNGIASGDGSGLSLFNSGGTLPRPITLSGTYRVTGNDDSGLSAVSLGAIKISNLMASENGAYGAYLTNLAASSQPVTLTGVSSFLDNGESGLWLMSRGAISAANLTATGNGFRGAEIYNDYDGATKVVLSGANVFSDNTSTGLWIESRGAVTLSNLTTSGNTGGGAWIANNRGAAVAASPAVTLSGTNLFNDNDYGLYIASYGAITANAVTAIGNGEDGVYLDNHLAVVPKAVKLTGANTLNDNSYHGLLVFSKGAISASSLTASGNHQLGAQLDNSSLDAVGGITLSGVNVLSDNTLGGLSISTRGPISLSSVDSSRNGGDGAYVYNNLAATPQAVKFIGTNTFNGNDGTGLDVTTLGAITISNLTASGNLGGAGADLFSGTPSTITLSGTNTFNDNFTYGLYAFGQGAFNINSLSAAGNGSDGANLTAGAAIQLTGTNTFHDNGTHGIVAVADTTLTANNLSSWGHTAGSGAGLHAQEGVTLTGINLFSNNFGTGLDIDSAGPISLTRITADDNGNRGVSISGPATTITITCASITSNGTNGIVTDAIGLLKLIGVVSSGNGMADILSGTPVEFVRTCPLK